jgi:hypothetical protein
VAYEKIQAAFDAKDCRTLAPATESDLADILTKYDIDHQQWGQGTAKSLSQLFEEIKARESRLVAPENGSVLGRILGVAAVNITTNVTGTPLRLVEERQVFRNGGERQRQLAASVSEKIIDDEAPEAAAIRGIKEELGVAYGGLLTRSDEKLIIRESSESYPGLLSIYRTHTFAATFSEQEYRPDGYAEVQPDRTTYFSWQPSEAA